MKFCWVTLAVDNMDQSLKFYHDLLGLSISTRFSAGDDVEIAMLGQSDQPKIELMCNKRTNVTNGGTGVSIGFEVDSLDETLAYLQVNHIPVKRGPISPSPRMTFVFVDDPDGFEVQLVQNK